MARPRGFADWNPSVESLELIQQVRAILDEYREHLPMTARQIFYRLVGAYGYDKTERAYSNLCEKLVRARRAGLVSFDAIRDDGTVEHSSDWGYADPASFWERLKRSGLGYAREPRQGQDYRIELWCEAAGMAPQLHSAVEEFGVSVYSTGGFSSVTVTHEIAKRASGYDEPTIFLHVGDFDPSGESIFEAISQDALHFYGGMNGGGKLGDFMDDFKAIRVALTADQVSEYELPTAPPKRSDSRSRNWHDETCQLEAMPPDTLAALVREAVEEWTDMDLLDRVDRESEDERTEIMRRLNEIEF